MAMKVVSARAMRDIEAAADKSVMSYDQMMRNAGAAASAYLQNRWSITAATKIVFLIGKGNNGGDGLVMALDLAQSTAANISLHLLEARGRADKHIQAARDQNLTITLASEDSDGQRLSELIFGADIIVDALFGIGLRLPLRKVAADLLCRVKECIGRRQPRTRSALPLKPTANSQRRPRPFVLAIDCPSGIDCDNGQADTNTLAADETITFIAAKHGLFAFPAAAYVGDLVISQIGIPNDLPALQREMTTVVDPTLAASLLPTRPLDGHKGTFGKVMLVAGSSTYIGAVALAGETAYRSGAGLVTIATTSRLIDIVAGHLREATWLPLADVDGAIAEGASETVIASSKNCDALLVGCGIGLHDDTRAFVRTLLAGKDLPPLIIDADALNFLSQMPGSWDTLPADTIITPHIGEMARLTALSTTQVIADRWDITRRYAKEWNLVIVLKSAHTLIVAPDGRTSVIPFKTDALATAGTGDVLAGLIAGLRAQGLNAFDAARLGAYMHALAGTIAQKQVGSSRSVIAGDVLESLGSAFGAVEAC